MRRVSSRHAAESCGSPQFHLAQDCVEARVVPDGVEVPVAEERHQILVPVFSGPIELLQGGIEFSEAEVDMTEARWKNVILGSLNLFQHSASFGFPPAQAQGETMPTKKVVRSWR